MAIRRVRFTFPKDLVTRAIIYELGRQYEVVTNIRRADVRADMGWVVLELEGADDEIERGLNWVSEQGVRVDPVTGDVLEG
jgi:L-aspartate semialdehyde sulfurtransferase ferredoxin